MRRQIIYLGDCSLSNENSSTVEQQLVTGKKIRKWYKEQAGQKPTKVQGQLATSTAFYRRALTKIVKSMFKITCPLDWDIDYQLNTLLDRGYYIISDTKTAGVLPITGSLTGINYIGLPVKAVMASPILGNWENEIGVDCEIIYLERSASRHYYNFVTIIDTFAQRFASADASIDVNLMNSRMAYVAEAENKAQADTIKKMYDSVSEGNPLVVHRQGTISGEGLKLFFNSVKNSYVADLVQDTKRTIMNEFLTMLGINNANTDKKERLISNEVDANNIELSANVDHWKETLERQCKKVKRIFPDLDFNIELRYDIEKMMAQMEAVSTVEQNKENKNDSK